MAKMRRRRRMVRAACGHRGWLMDICWTLPVALGRRPNARRCSRVSPLGGARTTGGRSAARRRNLGTRAILGVCRDQVRERCARREQRDARDGVWRHAQRHRTGGHGRARSDRAGRPTITARRGRGRVSAPVAHETRRIVFAVRVTREPVPQHGGLEQQEAGDEGGAAANDRHGRASGRSRRLRISRSATRAPRAVRRCASILSGHPRRYEPPNQFRTWSDFCGRGC